VHSPSGGKCGGKNALGPEVARHQQVSDRAAFARSTPAASTISHVVRSGVRRQSFSDSRRRRSAPPDGNSRRLHHLNRAIPQEFARSGPAFPPPPLFLHGEQLFGVRSPQARILESRILATFLESGEGATWRPSLFPPPPRISEVGTPPCSAGPPPHTLGEFLRSRTALSPAPPARRLFSEAHKPFTVSVELPTCSMPLRARGHEARVAVSGPAPLESSKTRLRRSCVSISVCPEWTVVKGATTA
jgi:hypothetical protein